MDEPAGVNRRRFRLALLGVFLLALGLRALVLRDFLDMPIQRRLIGDAEVYVDWGRRIAGGEVYGEEVFYQAPLYPYFLGLVFAVSEDSILAVRWTQALLGSLAAVLLGLAAARLFGPRAGLLAALLLALHPSAIFYDAVIQKSALDGFLLAVFLALLAVFLDRERPPTLLVIGAVLGLLALGRENALVLAPVLGLLVFLRRPFAGAGPQLRELALLGLGLALVLVPVMLRNHDLGGGFQLTTAQAGPNFYIGNHAGATGTYEPLRRARGQPKFERFDATDIAQEALGRELAPDEVSAFWMERALAWIRAEPGAFLRLLGRKAMLVLNRREVGDYEDQETYADWSRVLRVLGYFLNFGTLLPLALLGVLVGFGRHRRGALWLLVIAAVYALSVVAFYVYARYRFPLVHLLLLFVAAALADPIRALRGDGGPRALALRAGLVIAALVVAWWPVFDPAINRVSTLTKCALVQIEEGRPDEAIALLEQALALRPDDAIVLRALGQAQDLAGRGDEAFAAYDRARAIDPSWAAPWNDLGVLHMKRGEKREAREALRRAIELDARFAEPRHNFGESFLEAGKHEQALELFRAAHAIDPEARLPLMGIARAELAARRAEPARAALAELVARDPEDLEASYFLAQVESLSGRAEAARATARRGLEVARRVGRADWVERFAALLGEGSGGDR